MKRTNQSFSRGRKTLLLLYICFLATLSIALLLMPFGVRAADQTMAITYTAGALFWVGLLGTLIVASCLAVARRRDKKATSTCKRCVWRLFFQNPPAIVCDVVLIVSAIGSVITCVWAGTTIWPFPFLSLFIFSFGMHGMLNGSDYTYIKSQSKESN